MMKKNIPISLKMNKVDILSKKVDAICNTSISSPIEVARLQLELENEILSLRLALAKLVKRKSLNQYKKFRELRWEADELQSYNEASAGAKAAMSEYDKKIAEAKAYITYFENLTSIIKSFINSHFRDG